MPEAKITNTHRQTVVCGNTCRDIHSALDKVSNGARLVGASWSHLEVTLVFDYEEST